MILAREALVGWKQLLSGKKENEMASVENSRGKRVLKS